MPERPHDTDDQRGGNRAKPGKQVRQCIPSPPEFLTKGSERQRERISDWQIEEEGAEGKRLPASGVAVHQCDAQNRHRWRQHESENVPPKWQPTIDEAAK